jgi:hypothetical protein
MSPTNCSHYLQILRRLVPSARSFVVQAIDGSVLASGGTAAPLVYARLPSLIAQFGSSSDPPLRWRLVREDEPTYLLIVRDAAGNALGLLALVCDSVAVPADIPSIEFIATSTAAIVSLLVRELEMPITVTPDLEADDSGEPQFQRAQWQTQATGPSCTATAPPSPDS